jgi:hypothetical protein
MMMACQPMLDDVEGAVAAAQRDYAAYVGRELILRCISIASLSSGGDVDHDESQPAFDYFEGVDSDFVARGLALAAEVIDDGQPLDMTAWLERVRAFMTDAEATLQLGAPLPVVRSKDEMFPALATVRDWVDLCAQLGGPVMAIVPQQAGLW